MKIKKVKNIDKIKIQLSHLELIIIKKALKNSQLTLFDLDLFNNEVFDKDEVKSGSDIRDINLNIQNKINKSLKNIIPF